MSRITRKNFFFNLLRISVWSIYSTCPNGTRMNSSVAGLRVRTRTKYIYTKMNRMENELFLSVRIGIFYGNLFCLHFKCVMRNWIVDMKAWRRRRSESGAGQGILHRRVRCKCRRNNSEWETEEKWCDVMACIWWWRTQQHRNAGNRYVHLCLKCAPRRMLSPRLPSMIWCQFRGYFSFRSGRVFVSNNFHFLLEYFSFQRITVFGCCCWAKRADSFTAEGERRKKKRFNVRQLEHGAAALKRNNERKTRNIVRK